MARFGTSCSRWMFTIGSLLSLTACDDTKCFAPGKNLDTAYDEGAVGCGCSANDEDQCIDGVALACERGQWHAVEDGPCLPDGGEACGDTFCSEYAKCVSNPDGGQSCESTLFDSGVPDSGPAQHEAGGAAAEGGSSAQPGGEACGSGVCTEFGYCAVAVGDASSACRAKGNPGEACSEARECMSGKCGAGTCQDDGRNCIGTWDTSDSFAQTICKNRDCHVCVQSVDETGNPTIFGAVEPASCACPRPHWRSTSSASSDAGQARDR